MACSRYSIGPRQSNPKANQDIFHTTEQIKIIGGITSVETCFLSVRTTDTPPSGRGNESDRDQGSNGCTLTFSSGQPYPGRFTGAAKGTKEAVSPYDLSVGAPPGG